MPAGRLGALRRRPLLACLSRPGAGARTQSRVNPGLLLSTHSLSQIREGGSGRDLGQMVSRTARKRKLSAQGLEEGSRPGLGGRVGMAWFLAAEVYGLGVIWVVAGGLLVQLLPLITAQRRWGMAWEVTAEPGQGPCKRCSKTDVY